VQSFLAELFAVSRDDAHGRSNKTSIPQQPPQQPPQQRPTNYSPRLPYLQTESRRNQWLFVEYEYMPYSEKLLSWTIPKLSSFGPNFQARLIPKLLYDLVWHSWTKDRLLSVPPLPLQDFFSDDFDYVQPRMSVPLPPNPALDALRQRALAL